MIINAHCHCNLLDESCIQVAVYDERLEVTSPGGLYNGLTYEEVMNGHSKIRNKGIANIFSQMGLVEAWGSGIKRILNAAEEYGLSKPRFQEFDNMFRVELFSS
jgi:ATP-dependent DNA helicase RecG